MNVNKAVIRALSSIENAPLSFASYIAAFVAIIAIRGVEEIFLWGQDFSFDGLYVMNHFFQNLFLFLLLALVFTLFLSKVTSLPINRSANIIFFGLFPLILFSQILEFWISGGEKLLSFYELTPLHDISKSFISFFGIDPKIGVTPGPRTAMVLSVVLIFIYAFYKTRRWTRSLLTALGAYGIFFIFGTFPTWWALGVLSFSQSIFSITGTDMAVFFFAPGHFFLPKETSIVAAMETKLNILYALTLLAGILVYSLKMWRKKTIALIKNVRFAQVLYHGGLFLLGMAMAFSWNQSVPEISFFSFVEFLTALLSVIFAWCASVVINDIADRDIDEKTNHARPLIQNIFSVSEYKTVGASLFFTSLILALIVHPRFALFILAYQAIAWLYSCYPLRLKRFPIIATAISSVASLTILIAGYFFASPQHNLLSPIPWDIITFLFVIFTFTLPIKDFKDTEGDRSDGVWTLPVLLGERNARLFVGSALFLSYLGSVLILNARTLLLPAILFGSLAFWTVVSAPRKKFPRITDRNLPLYEFGIVFLYGVVILITIFQGPTL